ncbi:MAG: hypothetical protein ABI663_12670 [Chryseolinea sp.]
MNTKLPLTLHNDSLCENLFEMLQSKIRWTRLYIVLIMTFTCSLSQGQSLNKNWKEDLTLTLEQFLQCTSSSSDKTLCASFIEKSLASVYKIDALNVEASVNKSPALGLANNKGSQWSVVGMAFDQKALESAQRFANENKAVIAVYKPTGEDVKHVALILPGSLQHSGSWGYNVPNSASFFLMSPERSYIDKALSYAFAKNMLLYVTLYVRNK